MTRIARLAAKTALCAAMITASACSEELKVITLPSRTEELLENMSLQEKIEQMFIPSFRYSYYESNENYEPLTGMTAEIQQEISEHAFGGVILFGQNIQGCEQTVRLVQDFISANAANDHIPLLIAADQEGGTVRRITFGTYGCGNMALAASGDKNEIERTGELISDELSVLGINTDFAPDVDVNVNPANPIIGVRSFSDDPNTVSDLAKAFLKGMRKNNIVTALKHFPGHGDTDIDSHTGLPQVMLSHEELVQTHLIPFARLHNEADIIMSAHIEYPLIEDTKYTAADGSQICLPATMSKSILSGILRDEIGFDGVICTDAMTMDAVRRYFTEENAVTLAINAGADMILIPVYEQLPVAEYIQRLNSLVQTIAAKTESGEISIDRINESVMRILKLKEKRGILDTKPAESAEEQIAKARETVGSKEHHDQEFAAAEKGVTLLKNDGQVLPLSKDSTALLLVPFESHANSAAFAEEYLRSKGLLDQGSLPVVCYGSMSAADMIWIMHQISPDVIVMVTSVYSISDLSDYDLLLPVIEEAALYGIPQITLSAHLPYDLGLYDRSAVHMACYLASGMPAIPVFDGRDNVGYGANVPAALAVMYGDISPSGHLPVDIPAVSAEGGYHYLNELMYRRGDGISW